MEREGKNHRGFEYKLLDDRARHYGWPVRVDFATECEFNAALKKAYDESDCKIEKYEGFARKCSFCNTSHPLTEDHWSLYRSGISVGQVNQCKCTVWAAKAKKIQDLKTGMLVSYSTLYQRRKVVNPITGAISSYTASKNMCLYYDLNSTHRAKYLARGSMKRDKLTDLTTEEYATWVEYTSLACKINNTFGFVNHEANFVIIEHIKPIALGGTSKPDNIMLATYAENSAKGAKDYVIPYEVRKGKRISKTILAYIEEARNKEAA